MAKVKWSQFPVLACLHVFQVSTATRQQPAAAKGLIVYEPGLTRATNIFSWTTKEDLNQLKDPFASKLK